MPVSNESITKTINGRPVSLFYIGQLAYALGRTVQTIRRWEISGIIPPCFKDKNGKRLYTQDQINAIVSAAEECRIKQGGSIANTQFQSKVHKAIREINKNYGGK